MDDPKKVEEAIKQDLKAYQKLEKINKSDEFNDFFELQISTTVQKMLTLFTGTKAPTHEEYLRIRAEVVAMLYPIQQIRGAGVMKKQLQEQLTNMYNKEPV